MRPARLLLALLILALLLAMAPRPTVLAQDELAYERYDVTVTFNDDASFTVHATQQIRFDGEYDYAFAEIPLERTADVRDIQVYEVEGQGVGGESRTPIPSIVRDEGNMRVVEWDFDLTSPGEVRSWMLEYTVDGGLWVYDDVDYLRWPVINADRSGLPVEKSTVIVIYPPGAQESDISAAVLSENGYANTEGTFVVAGPHGVLPDGQPFEIEVGFPHGLLPAVKQPWQLQADAEDVEVTIPVLNVTWAIQPDGRIDVTENLVVDVERGTMERGFREIQHTYLDSIHGVSLSQDGEPIPMGPSDCLRCFTVSGTPAAGPWAEYDDDTGEVQIDEDAAAATRIEWTPAPVSRGETTTFELRYSVLGAIRESESGEVLNLEVLPDFGVRIDDATLTVVPPPGVATEAITIESTARQSEPEPIVGGGFQLRNLALPGWSPRWQVMLTLPAGATSAPMPRWQAQFEEAIAEQEAAQVAAARARVAWSVGGVLAVVGAAIAAVIAWMRYGRKRTREMLHGYLAEPPSDLAAGIVAYLMDREASERGVLASLFQLATAGLLEIDLSAGVQLRRTGVEPLASKSAVTNPKSGQSVPLAPHQRYLFDKVVLTTVPADHFVPLDALALPLRAQLPEIFAQMGHDAQAFFLSGSATSGDGCLLSSGSLWIALTVGAMALFGFFGQPVSLFVVIGALAVIAFQFFRYRPRGRSRSATGEEEAARWGRFRNYLINLKEYGDLAAAQDILDKYFAYAVALAVENAVLTQSESLGAAFPVWMPVPTHYPVDQSSTSGPTGAEWPRPDLSPRPMGTSVSSSQAAPQPSVSTPRPRPTLTGLSQALGESLASGSRSMGRTLTAAAGTAAASVVLKSQLKDRPMQFEAGAPLAHARRHHAPVDERCAHDPFTLVERLVVGKFVGRLVRGFVLGERRKQRQQATILRRLQQQVVQPLVFQFEPILLLEQSQWGPQRLWSALG